MSDYIIIALLALILVENSRFGVSIMNWMILQYKHVKHFAGRMFVK